MENVVGFPNERGRGHGGGPEDPDMEKRVAAVEARLERIEERLQSVHLLLVEIRANLFNSATKTDIADLRAEATQVRTDLSYAKGRIESLPTTWQMIFAVIGSWAVGPAAVIGVLAFFKG